jgi:CRP-like cAMP-binding protein
MDPDQRIAKVIQPYLFQNSFLLTNLPAEDLKKIENNTVLETGKRGKLLFRQNGFPNGVYWLTSGMAKIYQETKTDQRQTLYIYSTGDLMGHRQFIAEEVHPVTAVLLEDSTYRFIPGEIFRELLYSSTFFTRNMMTALAREFSVWSNRMTSFSHFPVRHRLALALLILHEQYRVSGLPKGVLTITRTELAEYVGATLETVVRMLNNLKADQVVSILGRKMVIKDINALVDIVESKEKK